MKKQELTKLREKGEKEMQSKLTELQAELTTAYLEKNANKLKSPAKIKSIKADIARLKTILNEK